MNTTEKKVKRGEIYVYDFGNNPGSIQCGIRPVLVLQGDEFNMHSPTTIIAPITTAVKKTYLPSHVYLGQDYGLIEPSMALIEQLKTVNQSELQKYIGCIDDEYTKKQIWKAFKKTLGMWDYSLHKNDDVYCLCGRCLEDMRYNPDIVISRLDPFQYEKETCVKCNTRFGFDYIISKKEKREQKCLKKKSMN